jgi:hypothetical protein
MSAQGVHDEANCQAEGSIRLANLETMVCELLRTNQILREELALLRRNTTANGIGAWGDIASPDSDLRLAAS